MPAELSNKIAAGEVVQRPASVAKELLDNAIDRGGDHITLIIHEACRTLIQCVDNACCMSQADALLWSEAHATSKMQYTEALFRGQTMRFRGGEKASRAAVPQIELRTKRIGDD